MSWGMTATTSTALLVRFDPKQRDEAIRETRRLLAQVGEPDALVRPCQVPGNLKVMTEGNPHEAQAAIAQLANANPEEFRCTSHWAVADQWVASELEAIRHAVAEYQRRIGTSDSWRVAVRHHETALRSQDVIDAVAPLLSEAPVDLEDPAKEVRIEVLGDETAVGLMDRSEMFRSR